MGKNYLEYFSFFKGEKNYLECFSFFKREKSVTTLVIGGGELEQDRERTRLAAKSASFISVSKDSNTGIN